MRQCSAALSITAVGFQSRIYIGFSQMKLKTNMLNHFKNIYNVLEWTEALNHIIINLKGCVKQI
jgi:hypothetical protein